MVVFCLHGLARQGDDFLDAEQRNQRCCHGKNRVPVHPRRNHTLETLRQYDQPQGLLPAIGEGFGGFPLSGGHRHDCAAYDFGNIGHDRQRQAENCLEPVRYRINGIADAEFVGQGQHDDKQNHQPGRVAEQLRDEPARPGDRFQRRYLPQPEHDSGQGAHQHGEKTDHQVEQEALANHERQPAPQRIQRLCETVVALRQCEARPEQKKQGNNTKATRRKFSQPAAELQISGLTGRVIFESLHHRQVGTGSLLIMR